MLSGSLLTFAMALYSVFITDFVSKSSTKLNAHRAISGHLFCLDQLMHIIPFEFGVFRIISASMFDAWLVLQMQLVSAHELDSDAFAAIIKALKHKHPLKSQTASQKQLFRRLSQNSKCKAGNSNSEFSFAKHGFQDQALLELICDFWEMTTRILMRSVRESIGSLKHKVSANCEALNLTKGKLHCDLLDLWSEALLHEHDVLAIDAAAEILRYLKSQSAYNAAALSCFSEMTQSTTRLVELDMSLRVLCPVTECLRKKSKKDVVLVLVTGRFYLHTLLQHIAKEANVSIESYGQCITNRAKHKVKTFIRAFVRSALCTAVCYYIVCKLLLCVRDD